MTARNTFFQGKDTGGVVGCRILPSLPEANHPPFGKGGLKREGTDILPVW